MPKLPLIDLSYIDNSRDDATAPSITEIGRACRSNGFFQIIGHGISRALQDDILEITQKLYSLPLSKKNELSLSLSTKKRGRSPTLSDSRVLLRNRSGYSGLCQQQLDPTGAPDMKESFYISENTPHSGNMYPTEEDVPNFRVVTSKYYDEMIRLSQCVFRLLASALSLPADTFDNYSGADGMIENTFGSTLRLVHYPPTKLESSSGQLSCGAHTDFGTRK
jgi:isopenicillin N synthase-like dioxygenase